MRYSEQDKSEDLFKGFSWGEDKPSWLAELKRGYDSHDGMLSGAWDKAKEIGGEWWKNISRDPTVNRDAYTSYWLERLGHEGPPLKEDSIYRGDIAAWETDYREYWDTKPLY